MTFEIASANSLLIRIESSVDGKTIGPTWRVGGELLARFYFLLVDLIRTFNSFGTVLTTDSWFVGYTFYRNRSIP